MNMPEKTSCQRWTTMAANDRVASGQCLTPTRRLALSQKPWWKEDRGWEEEWPSKIPMKLEKLSAGRQQQDRTVSLSRRETAWNWDKHGRVVTTGEDAVSSKKMPLDDVAPCCHDDDDDKVLGDPAFIRSFTVINLSGMCGKELLEDKWCSIKWRFTWRCCSPPFVILYSSVVKLLSSYSYSYNLQQ